MCLSRGQRGLVLNCPSFYISHARWTLPASGQPKKAAGQGKKPRRGLTNGVIMAKVSIQTLLEAGAHFGHQTRRWNPKMKPYIFGSRGDIYILDLKQTLIGMDRVYSFVQATASSTVRQMSELSLIVPRAASYLASHSSPFFISGGHACFRR